jgi:hypothetical protein
LFLGDYGQDSGFLKLSVFLLDYAKQLLDTKDRRETWLESAEVDFSDRSFFFPSFKTALLVLVYCTNRHNISKLDLITILFDQMFVIKVFSRINKNNMAKKESIDMTSKIPIEEQSFRWIKINLDDLTRFTYHRE